MKILAVASSGGHWSQLLFLSKALTNHDTVFLTTTLNFAAQKKKNKVIKVINADMRMKLKLCILALQVFYHVCRQRPNIVITTGAAPGYFAIVFGRLLGAKTIWVDSIANYHQLSMSGRHAKKHCDLFVSQWPHHKDTQYWGNIFDLNNE